MTWQLSFNTKGAKGDAGLGVLSGSGAPTASGVESQVYVDTTNGVLYQYTQGAWNSGKSLVGPMGLNGISGSFFAGNGAPTSSTYNGSGAALYVQSTGEVWLYDSTKKTWSDTGESLVGPMGPAGNDGKTIRGSQLYQGSGPPPSDTSSLSPAPSARDMWFDQTGGTFYTFS